jgi:hypothetical protein
MRDDARAESKVRSRGKCEPLSIDGTTIEIDTTDFDRVDYAGIFAKVTGETAER